MNPPITILGIAGSLRQGSYNRWALQAAQSLVPDGAQIEIFDLHGIPPFNQDEEQAPPAVVTEFKKRIRAADAILLPRRSTTTASPAFLKMPSIGPPVLTETVHGMTSQ
jgi:chromate reductase